MSQDADIVAIRGVLAELDPKASAAAADPLPPDEIYTPNSHGLALDWRRPLVVGNRGVGKSVWSGALADDDTRLAVSGHYPNLGLDRMVVQLGFHEGAGKTDGIAPSPALLSSLLNGGISPDAIWNAVLLRAAASYCYYSVPELIEELVAWAPKHIERSEVILRQFDRELRESNKIFVLVFDALDRLSNNWSEIRTLTQGVIRLTLNMQSYRAIRGKIFLRTDQAKDQELFRFPDASKMRATRVDLTWHSTELYGLLFNIILRDPLAAPALHHVANDLIGSSAVDIEDPELQRAIFSRIAGEFMGTDPRRGRTYTWLINHLADAFGETTPRSFLITLNRAANSRVKPDNTVIDHLGIREGVQKASEVRVDQLGEDYPWIRRALEDLEGLEVPCPPSAFTRRWAERGTIRGIGVTSRDSLRPGPLELEDVLSDPELALLEAVKNIGVVEERSTNRVNMPDIFRVAAGIKRRGGVRPPTSGTQRS